jgi:EmrB/QacA subfamily drug resistance transporter
VTSAITVTEPPAARRGRALALGVILLAAFLDLIGVTVLNVVLPAIQTDLRAGAGEVQWIQAGYTLALAVGMVTGARLGDLLGHKAVFITGLAGFAVASAGCALAGDAGVLVAARVVQGLFAAAMIPQVLSAIQVLYAPAERGGPMAFSALAGLAATVGPIAGPLLLDANLWGTGWRLVFWVNVPLAGLVAVAAAVLLPAARPVRARLDLVGVALSGAGLFLLLYPLITAADRTGWPVSSSLCLAAGAVVLAGFVGHQRWLSARGAEPLLRLELLRLRSVRGGLLVQLLFFVPTMGFFLVFMQFLQFGLGMSPLRAGLSMLPWSVAVPVFATAAAALLVPRIGRLTVRLGLVALAGGFVLIALAARNATPATGWADLVAGVVVGGAGMGLVVAPLTQLTLADVPVRDAGSGSALYNTVTQLAASVGVAVVGTLFFTAVRGVGHRPAALARGYGSALADSLWLGVAMLAVAVVATVLLPRRQKIGP